jgi:phosphotransferase system HPr-like phosphotransfer protein
VFNVDGADEEHALAHLIDLVDNEFAKETN